MNICLFCASGTRVPQRYFDVASEFGSAVARRGDKLLYGAGNMGLMLAAAEACLANNGYVVGVIPQFMVDNGWSLDGLHELIVTADMQERKRYLLDHSDRIVVLAGGPGTMDEFFEAVVLRQLGLLDADIYLVNSYGFYDDLCRQLEKMRDEQFIRFSERPLYHIVNDVASALQ